MHGVKAADMLRQARSSALARQIEQPFFGFAFDSTFPYANYWYIAQDWNIEYGFLFCKATAKDCAYDLDIEFTERPEHKDAYDTLMHIYIPKMFPDASKHSDWLTGYYFGKWLLKINFNTINTFHGGIADEHLLPGFFHGIGKKTWSFRGYDRDPRRLVDKCDKARVPTNATNVNFVRSINMDNTKYDAVIVDIKTHTVREFATLLLTKITHTTVSIIRVPELSKDFQPILILLWWVISNFEGRIFTTPWGKKNKMYVIFFPTIDRRSLDLLYDYASTDHDNDSNFVRTKIIEDEQYKPSLESLVAYVTKTWNSEEPKEAQARYIDTVIEA